MTSTINTIATTMCLSVIMLGACSSGKGTDTLCIVYAKQQTYFLRSNYFA